MRRIASLTVLLVGASLMAATGQDPRLKTPSVMPATGPIAPVAVEMAPDGKPWLNLGAGRAIRSEFKGPDRAVRALRAHEARPLSMAAADFDEDGVPDLVCGFAAEEGGIVTLHRGNVDAIYPNAPEAQERRRKGTFTDAAFLPDARVFETPDAPDFLGAGDFDADGHWDVVAASRAKARLRWHRGDGKGGLGPAETIALPGRPTAFATGEINRRDGLEDVVVGIEGPDGPEALVFEAPEGAFARAPERIGLPAPATSLALGQIDEEYAYDLLMAAGDSLVFVHGRDRRLSISVPGKPEGRPAVVERVGLSFKVTSISVGRFNAERSVHAALLSDQGSVYTARLDSILSIVRDGAKPETVLGKPLEIDAPASKLMRAKVSSLRGDDLLVMNMKRRQLQAILPPRAAPLSGIGAAIPAPTESVSVRHLAHLAMDADVMAILLMRLNVDGLDDLVILADGVSAPLVLPTDSPMTFFVTNANDSGPGSLRQAVLDAEANDGADTIEFAIPGSGPHYIRLSSKLPSLFDSLTIDGSTQPGFAGTPLVALDGSLLPATDNSGLSVGGAITIIRSLSIINVADEGTDGLAIECGGYVQIEGNYIGVDPAGVAAPNNVGVVNGNNCTGFVGGTVAASRNVISGNTDFGILIFGLASMVVQGNLIGTHPSGAAALGNGTGIHACPSNTFIGGATAGARNLISGNTVGVAFDVCVPEDAEDGGPIMQGNFIGTDASGLAALANTDDGVRIENSYSADVLPVNGTVGGTSPGARNVISGNGHGISIQMSGNLVQGNYIGIGANGSTAVPNGDGGVRLLDGSDNTIGGTVSGAKNVISGQDDSYGVYITSVTRNTVAGNYIGTDASGTVARPNRRGIGIDLGAFRQIIGQPLGGNVISGNSEEGVIVGLVFGDFGAHEIANNLIGLAADGVSPLGNGGSGVWVLSSSGNLIGGLTAAEKNIIAHNGGAGIRASSPFGPNENEFIVNSIHDNAGLGIDLSPSGVNANDPGDPDDGSNHLQNYPVLTLAQTTGESVRVDGMLDSTPLSSFAIRIYASPACDPSGYGEGKYHLGSFVVSTDADGLATFSETLPAFVLLGEAVTATADTGWSTSEFSACATAVGVPPAAVTNVRFESTGPGTVLWDAEPGAIFYHAYAGTASTLSGLASPAADSCEAGVVPTPGFTIPPAGNPPPGEMLWFLVTAEGPYGEGPVQPGNPKPRVLNSVGPCGDSCAHDDCEVGVALVPACTPCASIICDKDPFCCDPVAGSWDAQCVQEMRTVCRSLRCAESQGQCPHDLCCAGCGEPLPPGCDSPPLPVSCTAAVCQVDPHCCQQVWDDACVAKVATICGYGCI